MTKSQMTTKQNKTNQTTKTASKTKAGLKQSKAQLKAANKQLQLELRQREQVEKELKTRVRRQQYMGLVRLDPVSSFARVPVGSKKAHIVPKRDGSFRQLALSARHLLMPS